MPLDHAWYDGLRWFDWVAVVGVVITVAGLAVTWWQAKKARDAAEAVKIAVSQTEAQLRNQQLLVLIPQLRWLTGELDAAIDADEDVWARRHLDSWRWHASNVRGLFSITDVEEKKILRSLQDSVSQAASAGDALRTKRVSVDDATQQARMSIGKACDALNDWVGRSVVSSNVVERVEQR